MAVMKSLPWRKARGRYFDDVIRKAQYGDRAALLEKVSKYREIYFREPGGFDATAESGPWEGAADLHFPLVTQKVETGTPKIMSALWRANPFVTVTRPGGSNFTQEGAKNIENFTTWAFRNDIPGFYLTLENFLRTMSIEGTAFMKIRWDRKVRRGIEIHYLEANNTQDGVDYPKSDIELITEIFGLGDVEQTMYKYNRRKDGSYDVWFTEQGLPYKCKVEITDDKRVTTKRVRVFRDVIERESPSIELVDLEDIVFPYRAKSIQSAKWVAHKTWYSYREIKAMVDSGEWHLTKKQMATLKANSRVADTDKDQDNEKDYVIGEESHGGHNDTTDDGQVDPNMILVWEVYAEDYVDENAMPINVVYFLPEQVRTIAGMEYHDEIFPHGKRPFVSATYIPIAGRIYGIGMAELLYGVNLSMDHTMNTIHNAMEITTTPFFFYSPMNAAQNGQNMLRIRPGQGIPLMNPREVYFPQIGQQPLENYHATFNQMSGIADSLTFSNSVAGNNNYRNAPRTAKGTMALMDAAEEQLSTLVEQLQATAWKEMIQQVVALYGKYLTIDKWYQVTGEPEARHISPRELRDNLMFEFSGSLTSVNRDVQRSLMQAFYQMVSPDPAYQNDPNAMNNLRRALAEHFLENGDVEAVLPAPPGEGGLPHPKWTQEQELRAMATGQTVAVLPVDDHMTHIKDIEKFKQTEVYAILPGEVRGLIESHLKHHEETMQQQMAQNQRAVDTGGSGAATQVATPGSPTQGVAAQGGNLSQLGGF